VPAVADPDVLVGALTGDDAAVYRVNDEHAIVATVDFFTPIVDDAYAFGAIAAANAFSDVYAMGAAPTFALNLVAWPRQPELLDLLGDATRGAADVVAEAGAVILGGHSIDDPEPKLGMVVIGVVAPDRLITNANARPGDLLLLTKPLGTGIMSTALKQELIDDAAMGPAITAMRTLNADAAAVMRDFHDAVHAATDVTGFGLLGHLHNMLTASGVGARLAANRVPTFEGVGTLVERGAVPGGTRRNLEAAQTFTTWAAAVDERQRLILADAQTSGGLLIAIDPSAADAMSTALTGRGVLAAAIGAITDGEPGAVSIDLND
jgi:selenide,water dikinase